MPKNVDPEIEALVSLLGEIDKENDSLPPGARTRLEQKRAYIGKLTELLLPHTPLEGTPLHAAVIIENEIACRTILKWAPKFWGALDNLKKAPLSYATPDLASNLCLFYGAMAANSSHRHADPAGESAESEVIYQANQFLGSINQTALWVSQWLAKEVVSRELLGGFSEIFFHLRGKSFGGFPLSELPADSPISHLVNETKAYSTRIAHECEESPEQCFFFNDKEGYWSGHIYFTETFFFLTLSKIDFKNLPPSQSEQLIEELKTLLLLFSEGMKEQGEPHSCRRLLERMLKYVIKKTSLSIERPEFSQLKGRSLTIDTLCEKQRLLRGVLISHDDHGVLISPHQTQKLPCALGVEKEIRLPFSQIIKISVDTEIAETLLADRIEKMIEANNSADYAKELETEDDFDQIIEELRNQCERKESLRGQKN